MTYEEYLASLSPLARAAHRSPQPVHQGVSPMQHLVQESGRGEGLLRVGDIFPGTQQALAARDLSELNRDVDEINSVMSPEPSWWQKGLLGAGQALTGAGILPMIGGVTAKTGRGLTREAVESITREQRESALQGLRSRLYQNLNPAGGGAVTGGRGPGTAPFVRRPFSHGSRRSAPGSLGGHGVARYDLESETHGLLGDAGVSNTGFIELADSPESRKFFRTKGKTAQRKQGAAGAQVDIYKDPEEYAGARLFMSEDGKSGFAIKPDGDIVSVFKNPGTGGKDWGAVATALATQEGGRKLDAFDSFLPTGVYSKTGYEHRAGTPFNDEYKPENWNYDELGRPNVSAMSYSPEGQNYQYPLNAANRGIEVPGVVPEYDDMIAARDASPVYAGELTPGVNKQLHEAVPRMSDDVGSTVAMAPEGLLFPGVYQSPEEIIKRGLLNIADEDPDLKKYFGMTRAEMDEATRKAQGVSPAELPVPPAGDAGLHASLLDNPANTERLRDTLALAASEPGFAGSYGWYHTNPLRDKYVEAWGPEVGQQKFDQLMQASSVMSANSPVDLELRRASLWQKDPQRFINADLSSGEKIFKEYPELFDSAEDAGRYAAMYHKGTQVPGLTRLQNTGNAFDPQPSKQIKTKNYYESKMGRNFDHPTMDAHFVRGVGLADLRPIEGAAGSIGGPEAAYTRDWFESQVAEPLGMKGSPAQALMWNAMAPQTGVKTKAGAPYLELLLQGAKKEAEKRGKSVDEVLDEFVRGTGLLSRNNPTGLLGSVA